MSLGTRLVQALRPAVAPGRRCSGCRHFLSEPFHLERAMPGYAVLASALGSVRAGDGHCERHQRCVAAHGGCEGFSARN